LKKIISIHDQNDEYTNRLLKCFCSSEIVDRNASLLVEKN